VLATHKGEGRRGRDEWTGVNRREIGRFSVLGHIFGFVVSSEVRLSANIKFFFFFFFFLEAVNNSFFWSLFLYL